MSTRTYLSIGDVLSLLREEFPDVTISKIRFLESQGLVNPERSPSGYRKFYEQDVERLRWVLRQQREHFLPLKVIRDRLAQEGGNPPRETPATGRQGGVAPVGAQSAQSAQAAPLPATSGAATGVLGPRPLAEPVKGEGSAAFGNGGLKAARAEDPAIAQAVGVGGATAPAGAPVPLGGREQQSPVTGAAGTISRPAPVGETAGAAGAARAQDPERTPPADPERHAADAPAAPTPAVPAPDQPSRPAPRREPTASEGAPGSAPLPQSGRAAQTGHAAPAGPAGVTGQTAGGDVAELPAGVSGASLTIDELCAASGLSVTEVASLEGFGLVEPMSVAGILYYDEEALVVAKLVASYRRYGIEPRHLRLYRNAVDREMGLVEQIVTPLLRQRNPEARQRAADAAAELAKLGQQLRGSLLRREIRRQLGG